MDLPLSMFHFMVQQYFERLTKILTFYILKTKKEKKSVYVCVCVCVCVCGGGGDGDSGSILRQVGEFLFC